MPLEDDRAMEALRVLKMGGTLRTESIRQPRVGRGSRARAAVCVCADRKEDAGGAEGRVPALQGARG